MQDANLDWIISDMLTADDDQTSTLKDSIRMDHCYTTSCGKDSLGQPGPSGSSKVGETSRDADENSDSQEHEDEEETESEEELDSEEEAKRKRSRARGRVSQHSLHYYCIFFPLSSCFHQNKWDSSHYYFFHPYITNCYGVNKGKYKIIIAVTKY
jgi:hypothetical protein